MPAPKALQDHAGVIEWDPTVWPCDLRDASMPTVNVKFTNVPGTEAALGLAGNHGVVIDRADGSAGGKGLGLNGAQLLALAIGGCFCNDLRHVSHRHGRPIASMTVEVRLTLEGEPLIATSAEIEAHCRMVDGSDPGALMDEATRGSMVGLSLPRGIPVSVAIVD